MSARNKSWMQYLIRGSEIFRHQFQMLGLALSIYASIAIAVALVVVAALSFVVFSEHDRSVFFYNRVAALESSVGMGGSSYAVRSFVVDGITQGRLYPSEILYVTKKYYDEHLSLRGKLIIFLALISACGTFAFAIRSSRKFGVSKSKDEFLRGARLVSPSELTAEVRKGKTSPYTIAGIPLPAGMEMRNFLFTGAQGSGKTVVIEDLMDQVFAAGKKAIIYDKKGEYTEKHYRPGQDFILNVFDSRFAGWDLFSEVETETDFDQMGHSLCPDPEDKNSTGMYFAAGARAVFAEGARYFWRQGNCSTKEFVSFLLTSTPTTLSDALAGTPAAAFIDPKAGEQAGGVISSLVAAIGSLRYLPDGHFSIKEWVHRDDDSRLFINSHETVHDVLRPITAMWLDLAIRNTMTLPRVYTDRLWIFLDELASLKSLSIISRSVTETRAFGVVHVIGLQDVAQGRAMFGKDHAQVFRSNLQTQVLMRVSDEETAEAYSKMLGVQELDEKSEGVSFGAAPSRDGSNLNTGRKEKRIVLASEIQLLNDCEGFLQIVGNFPVAKIKYQYKERANVQPRFCPRDDLRLTRQIKQEVSTETVEIPQGEINQDDLTAGWR